MSGGHDYTLQFDWDDLGAIYATVDDFVDERVIMRAKTRTLLGAFLKSLSKDIEKQFPDEEVDDAE